MQRFLLDGPDIHELLQRVRDEHGPEASIVHAERIRTGGVAGFFARQRYEVAVEVDIDAPPPMSLASQIVNQVDGDGGHHVHAEPGAVAAACDEVLAASPQNDGPSATTSSPFVQPASDAASTEPRRNPLLLRPVGPAHQSAAPASMLKIVAPLEITDVPVAPLAAPRVPRRPGEMLVLIGDGPVAYQAALDIARSARIPTTRILVASSEAVIPRLLPSRRVTDVVQARLQAAELALGSSASIIVVAAPIGLIHDAEGQDWVSEIVHAVGPTDVWAVVDATRHQETLARWLDAVGPVSALVVHDAACNPAAASIGELGCPIAFEDGRPVDPVPPPQAREPHATAQLRRHA